MAGKQDVLVVGESLVLHWSMLVILHCLRSSESEWGVIEDELLDNLELENSEVFENLAILEKRGFVSSQSRQACTGGGCANFWKLAEGVCVQCTISKNPPSA